MPLLAAYASPRGAPRLLLAALLFGWGGDVAAALRRRAGLPRRHGLLRRRATSATSCSSAYGTRHARPRLASASAYALALVATVAAAVARPAGRICGSPSPATACCSPPWRCGQRTRLRPVAGSAARSSCSPTRSSRPASPTGPSRPAPTSGSCSPTWRPSTCWSGPGTLGARPTSTPATSARPSTNDGRPGRTVRPGLTSGSVPAAPSAAPTPRPPRPSPTTSARAGAQASSGSSVARRSRSRAHRARAATAATRSTLASRARPYAVVRQLVQDRVRRHPAQRAPHPGGGDGGEQNGGHARVEAQQRDPRLRRAPRARRSVRRTYSRPPAHSAAHVRCTRVSPEPTSGLVLRGGVGAQCLRHDDRGQRPAPGRRPCGRARADPAAANALTSRSASLPSRDS